MTRTATELGSIPGRAAPEPPGDPTATEVSPLRVTNFVLRNRRGIIIIPLAAGLVAGILNLFTHHEWQSSASFMPQAQSKNPGAKIAQEFGVDIGSGDDAQNSPQFYVSLLKSRPLLEAAVLNKYSFRVGKDSITGNLIELFDVGGPTEARRLLDASKELADNLTVSADIRTGTVGLSVKTEWAPLSKAILEKLLADVNDFNARIRRSRASAEREFVASVQAQARDTLRQAEDRLQAFNLQNRGWANDPGLVAAHDRLLREVNLLNLRYGTLTQNLDQAAIDAVRNTPVITVIEPPMLPPKPEGRGTTVKALLAVIVFSVFGTLFALFREYGRRANETGSEDLRQFKVLLSESTEGIRARLGRLWPRRRAP